MTGLFNQIPTLPRYTKTWNPQIILNYLNTFPAFNSMSLKQLTLKLMLMGFLSVQRTQTFQKLSLDEMYISPGKYTFYISSLLKQTSAKGATTDTYFLLYFGVSTWAKDFVLLSYYKLIPKGLPHLEREQSNC